MFTKTYLYALVIAAWVLVPAISTAWARSNPEQKARDAYAHEIAIAAEHDGWDNISITAAKPGALFGRLGNHDALRIEARQQGIFAPYMTLDTWNVRKRWAASSIKRSHRGETDCANWDLFKSMSWVYPEASPTPPVVPV